MAQEGRIAVLVVSHGPVASGMAQVANAIMGELQYFFQSGVHQNSVHALLKEAPTPNAIASMHMTPLTHLL